MIYLAFDSGYVEITENNYPSLLHILNNKTLKYNDEDKNGQLTNVRRISKKLLGEKLILTELILSPLHYITAITEINVGHNPVLFYKPLNCLIQLKKELQIIN